MNSSNKSKFLLFGFILFILIVAPLLFPLPRLYVSAFIGSSDAMYKLSMHYFAIPERVLFHKIPPEERAYWASRQFKGDYWLRKSLEKGNMHALLFITGASGNGGYLLPKEQGYWLIHGCDLGIPWCAEQMARGYFSWRFGLDQDLAKSREFDNLAVDLHRKKGTLKDHACIILPGTSTSVGADSPYSPFTQRELHPGILRESITKK